MKHYGQAVWTGAAGGRENGPACTICLLFVSVLLTQSISLNYEGTLMGAKILAVSVEYGALAAAQLVIPHGLFVPALPAKSDFSRKRTHRPQKF